MINFAKLLTPADYRDAEQHKDEEHQKADAADQADDVLEDDDGDYIDNYVTITARLFRTRRRTYQLSRIEKTEVKRIILPYVLPVAVGLLIFTWHFAELMDAFEQGMFVLISALLLLLGINVGVMSVTSKALEEICLYGSIGYLKYIRDLVDEGIEKIDLDSGSGKRGGLDPDENNV